MPRRISPAQFVELTLVAISLQTACSKPYRYYPDDDAGYEATGGKSNPVDSHAGGGATASGSLFSSGTEGLVGGSSTATVGGDNGGPLTGGISSSIGGAHESGGSPSLDPRSSSEGGAVSGSAPSGGAQWTGGASSLANTNGGATAAASTAMGTSSGGIPTGASSVGNGGANPTGGAPTIGGGVVTGGAPTTGGTTACSSNLQSDPANCGACGHDCLGGGCVTGQCMPAAVAESSSHDFNLFGIDDKLLYYTQTEGPAVGLSSAYRVSKSGIGATGSALITGRSYSTFYGPIGTTLYWTSTPYMSSTRTAYRCDTANCTEPAAGWRSGIGAPFDFHSMAPIYFATLEPPASGDEICGWDDGRVVQSLPVSSAQNDQNTLMAAGDAYYWISKKVDPQGHNVSAALFSSNLRTHSQAQLAANITPSTVMVDANNQSVLLFDYDSKSLLRVPLPLGLGSSAPSTLMDSLGDAPSATEDSTGVYILDGQGTLSKCSPANCASTAKVLAVGQNTHTAIYQDSSALYWSHANPNAIERLAK